MLYTTFGNTGLEISRLGFGGMRFECPSDTEGMAEVVLHAFRRGVTYFDTAPEYCDDQSETIVGMAVQEMKKTGRPFYISTKTMASSPDDIRRQCESSLSRLNVDCIDFYHVWCLVKPEDLPKRKRAGALAAFQKLKEEKLIRHISVSTHLEHQHVADMLDEGEGLFESMLIGINVQNYHLRCAGVWAAAERGMAVVTMNTLGGGVLTDHQDRFLSVLRDSDTSMVEAALRFNLSLSGVTTALIGCRNREDVDAAVEAVEIFKPLNEAAIEEISDTMRHQYKEYCTQCGYCSGCPEHVPVVRLMETYNLSMLNGMDDALKHLRYHWNTPDVRKALESCTQCRQCEEVCTQQLPILERFAELKAAHEAGLKG